ncbi:MAG: ral nucleoside transport system permease protein [Candidatus Eremiobacteraeota bacterium]|nr:ral nucleoside transport system permease protein [Candidatus Eremiobacteraeota bacterium]
MSPLAAGVLAVLGLTLVKATPLIYAALGGVLSERAGVVNIGLEGILIAGAFTAVAVSGATGSPFLGALAGVVAGALLAALLAYAATKLAVDQIVAGTGLNIAALAAAAYGLVLVFHQPGASHEVPALGKSGETWLIVLAFVAAAVLHFVLTRTPWGLRVRACGEDPSAAESAGIDALRTRFTAVVIGGAIAALGGVYLSLAELDLYSDGMTAGRGFIALAAVIFGRWTPLGATGAALFFGFFAALQYSLQRAGVPSELMQALPYLAALVALAGLAGRARAPAADGVPYVRQ